MTIEERTEAFRALFEMSKDGLLKMKIEKAYPLSEVKAAVTRAAQGKRSGKILFEFAASRRLCQRRRALHPIAEFDPGNFRGGPWSDTAGNRNLHMNIRTFFRAVPVLAVVFVSLNVVGAENSGAPEPGDLRTAGTVDFPVSCAPAVQAEFVRGVALLHSFFYEEARRIFTGVAEKDPTCAMAQWGIAMTWWHPIWTPPTPDEMKAGKAAIDKAMAMTGGTDRERLFIAALNSYYNTADGPVTGEVGQSCHGPVGPRGRVAAYEKAMRKLYDKYPDDFETQTFYALAVLAVGYATPTDTTLSNQLRAADILEKLWKKNSHHPGVAHYLIHSYDYPALAQRGLAAARSYSSIAPWVPHALHMPSHIFTRLGMWEESIAANRSSRTRRALTRSCDIATPPKQRSYTRSTTWLIPICRKHKIRRRRRSSISRQLCAKPIPRWNSADICAGCDSVTLRPRRNAWAKAAALPIPIAPLVFLSFHGGPDR